MDILTQSFNKNPGSMILILILGLAILLFITIWQVTQTKKLKQRWSSLMDGSQSGNLESMLERHIHELESLRAVSVDAIERIEGLERKIKSAKRYVGLVKYDAFEDVGGSQSFSLAIYDEEGHGAIVTSLVGREGCRVYGKTLANGKSDRNLSTEEEMAIEYATNARGRPRISS